MDEQKKTQRARKQVEAMIGFYVHLAVFGLVMALLFLVNAYSTSNWWVQWPALGWGFGVLMHGLAVFARTPRFIRNWQLRKIREVKNSM